MTAYYNEWDEGAAAWLRELIAMGLIPAGDVDTRSIADVRATDLVGYGQCHFFAGIGGWPLAFRLAGVPDNFPAWSGSTPCQPYGVSSNAHGGAQGQGDSRHLWPQYRRLIAERQPPAVFGEQVASAIPWGWLDEVGLDLEAEGYAFGASVLRADAVEADHQRRRICWVADSRRQGREGLGRLRAVRIATGAQVSQHGNPLALARRALDGDRAHLLPRHGVSLKLDRGAIKGFGNAIVPEVAQAFIEAVMEAA